jgi:ribosomal protein L37AE/L43A
MAYSKETQRQNQALGDILTGRETEKRVMVGYKGKEKEKGDIVPKMTEIMQDVRMPLFCKTCTKVMKKRLDDKMWRLYNHCFDCQIAFENQLRIEGKYDEWEKEKVKQNKISFLKDQIQALEEWRDKKAPVFYNQVGVNYPELEKERWAGDTPAQKEMAVEALEKYTEVLNELENIE